MGSETQDPRQRPQRSLSGLTWSGIFAGPAQWPPKSQLLRQYEVPNVVYVVDEGVIKFTQTTADGNQRVIDVRAAPTLIGSYFIIEQRRATMEAITVTTCSVRWCAADAFRVALETDIRRLVEIDRAHCDDIIQLLDRIACLSTKSSKKRLARFLAAYHRCEHQSMKDTCLPFSQSELAAILNVTPEHLSRIRTRNAKASDRAKTNGTRKASGQ